MYTDPQTQLTATLHCDCLNTITSSGLYAAFLIVDSLSFENAESAGITGIDSQNDLKDLVEAVNYIQELSKYKSLIQDFQVPVRYLKFIKQLM